MQRIPEPELMDEEEQVRAYAQADFEASHSQIIDSVKELLKSHVLTGWGVDLGCGPGDMIGRLLRAFPDLQIEGVDGGINMIRFAERHTQQLGFQPRISFTCGRLPAVPLKRTSYNFIFSNSLLHHLPDPMILWDSINKYGKNGTVIFVCDLIRPESPVRAREIVETYSANEPEVLKKDFYNSLLAAYTVEEVRSQLKKAGLSGLTLKAITDRHLVVFGEMT